jgi:hypothetical protein
VPPVDFDEQTRERQTPPPARPRDPYAVPVDPLVAAWEGVQRDATDLVALYQQARMAPTPAFFSPTGRRKDRIWIPSWFLIPFQPSQRVYVNTPDGRAMGTTTTPEVPGLALLVDAALYQYRLVRAQPMLMTPLRQATPNSPPPHSFFAAAARRIVSG